MKYPNDLDPRWDNKTLEYDLAKHNWPEYWLGVAKQKFPQITSLETVHEVLTTQEISELGKHCQDSCKRSEFVRRANEYYKDLLDNVVSNEWMIQRYFTVRIVIPNQQNSGRLLPFHSDIWTGNGLGVRALWTPITESYDTNSMQVVDYDSSIDLMNRCYRERWSFDQLQTESRKKSSPINLVPGQAFLFQSQHIHGNFNNETEVTRWSMDGRILIQGGHYHKKLPGGYFRFLDETSSQEKIDLNKKYISYAGWNSKYSRHIPLPMQRSAIADYCKMFNIKINDYQFENDFLDWLPSLEQFITSYNIDAIVMCSIFSLPDDPDRRYRLLKLAVDSGVELHFANEVCSVRTHADIKHIKHIFEFVNENPDPNVFLGLADAKKST